MPEITDALTAVADRAERDRLRVQLTGERFQPAPQQYSFGGLDWQVLDSREHRSPKVAGRHAVAIDLEVSRAGVLVFRDRILVWDGLRVLTPDPGGRMEVVAGLRPGGRSAALAVPALIEAPLLAAQRDLLHTVGIVTRGFRAPHLKERFGTVSTFFGNTADGWINSDGAGDYATARAGNGLVAESAATTMEVGQGFVGGQYFCSEGFLAWDTSAIPDTDTVSVAVLSVYGQSSLLEANFTIQARTKAWLASLTTADWVAGASLGGLTLLATFATSGWSNAAYNDFTSEAAILAWISKTGNSECLLDHNGQADNTDPAPNDMFVYPWTADQTGTTNDPKLVVTHAAAGGGGQPPRSMHQFRLRSV